VQRRLETHIQKARIKTDTSAEGTIPASSPHMFVSGIHLWYPITLIPFSSKYLYEDFKMERRYGVYKAA
jgi:hypothetical protein